MRYFSWQARIRRDIKQAIITGPNCTSLFSQWPEMIALMLGMDDCQIFYARTLNIKLSIYEMSHPTGIVNHFPYKWDQQAVNPWRQIYKKQKEHGWWSGQTELPL